MRRIKFPKREPVEGRARPKSSEGRSEMKAVCCGATTLAFAAAISLAPALARCDEAGDNRLEPPPPGSAELLDAVMAYHELWNARTTKDFQTLKSNFPGSARQ